MYGTHTKITYEDIYLEHIHRLYILYTFITLIYKEGPPPLYLILILIYR